MGGANIHKRTQYIWKKNAIEINIIEEKSENTFVCLSDIKDQVNLNEILNIKGYLHYKTAFCLFAIE